ncbi:MAG: helix-turn-helix transcriptional regulator [Balneolales bacterium]
MSTTNQKIFGDFSDALDYVLRIKGLSPSEFARKWGKDDAQVSRYLNNKSIPYPRTIKVINRLLGVDIKKTPTGKWELRDVNFQYPNYEHHMSELETREPYVASEGLSLDDLERTLSIAESAIRTCRDTLELLKKKGLR